MKILERLRLQHQIKNIPTGTTNPLLKKQLEKTEKDLNSILKNWKFGDVPIKTSEEFINKFGGWINKQLKDQQEAKEFLKKYSVDNLEELKDYIANSPTGETSNEELANFLKDNRVKDLHQLQGLILDLEREINELKEKKGTSKYHAQELQNLTLERDEAIREKKTAEQESLSLNNLLRNKQEEVNKKLEQIEQIKKDKAQTEIALNKKLEELKKKYSKQGQLLDGEQTDNNKLNKKIESLEKERKNLLTENEELFDEITKLKGGVKA